MSAENAKTLFNKLIEDKKLLEQLKADPETVLKAYGCTKEELKELEMTAREHEITDRGKELDTDELAAVSGGGIILPTSPGSGNCAGAYFVNRCAATVEKGSGCWSNDYCLSWSSTYTLTPEAHEKNVDTDYYYDDMI